MKNLKELQNYLEDILDKESVIRVLEWVLDTSAPKDSHEFYQELITKINMKVFELVTNDKYLELLTNFLESDELKTVSDVERIYYQDLYEEVKRTKNVPHNFFLEYTRLKTQTKEVWTNAKAAKNYELFKPYLTKMIKMTKEYYRYLYPDGDIYDHMLDEYEKGMLKEDIDKLFDKLKKEIIPIVKNLKVSNINPYKQILSDDKMKKAASFLLNYIGFDMDKGALGIFPHGYTTAISTKDIRIAFSKTPYLIDFFSTIIHEGGHGIFEQSYGRDILNIPNYQNNSFALHESQSRFYENILGRNENFWLPIFDELKEMVDLKLDFNELMANLNNAHPSLIRTEADELTYCLHIIIRYEIERGLFDETIDPENLPNIWNDKMKEYLGVEVTSDEEGILQDVHWACGEFGYFPSYLLGSIFDGMLIELVEKNVGNIDELLRDGKIKKITEYLQKEIHINGGVYGIKEVVKKLTNSEMDVMPIVEYFKSKYN